MPDYHLTTSPFGRVLHAIREDEVFAKAFGKNTLYFKVTAFAVSAALAASAGSLYATYIAQALLISIRQCLLP